jgi:hypothetical protein
LLFRHWKVASFSLSLSSFVVAAFTGLYPVFCLKWTFHKDEGRWYLKREWGHRMPKNKCLHLVRVYSVLFNKLVHLPARQIRHFPSVEF